MAIEICDVGGELTEIEYDPTSLFRVAECSGKQLEDVAGRMGLGGDVRIGRSG